MGFVAATRHDADLCIDLFPVLEDRYITPPIPGIRFVGADPLEFIQYRCYTCSGKHDRERADHSKNIFPKNDHPGSCRTHGLI